MYVGLDIGTSGTKAALVEETGRVLCSHQVSYGFANTAGGYRELDAEVIWQAVLQCLDKVGHHMEVRTITVSALGEAIVLTDENGKPLATGIAGTDIRGTQELEELKIRFGERQLIDVTGQNLSTIYSANKILWLKKNQPQLLRNASKILTFQDYIIYRLSGRAVIDYSMASRTMLFDINKMDWFDPLIEAVGITREQLAEPAIGGSIVGCISEKIAAAIGISADAKIVVGTHDHIANAIGSGVCEVGSCSNTVGTTEGLTAVLRRDQLPSQAIDAYQISCEPFALKGLFNTVAWHNASGVLLRWFVQEFVLKEKPGDILNVFADMNSKMSDEPTKLLVLPHFSGAATPHMDSRSTGVIVGLTLDTSRDEIYKAMMEGANFETAQIMDSLKKAGLQPRKLIATGGALSPQLLQIKADILGLEVYTVQNRQTGTLGGAMLGAVVSGTYGSLKEAAQVMVTLDRSYEPNPIRHTIYQEKIELYKKIYPAVCEISHGLMRKNG